MRTQDTADVPLPEYRSEVVDGFVFVNLDGTAAPLAPQLSGLRELLTNWETEKSEVYISITYTPPEPPPAPPPARTTPPHMRAALYPCGTRTRGAVVRSRVCPRGAAHITLCRAGAPPCASQLRVRLQLEDRRRDVYGVLPPPRRARGHLRAQLSRQDELDRGRAPRVDARPRRGQARLRGLPASVAFCTGPISRAVRAGPH